MYICMGWLAGGGGRLFDVDTLTDSFTPINWRLSLSAYISLFYAAQIFNGIIFGYIRASMMSYRFRYTRGPRLFFASSENLERINIRLRKIVCRRVRWTKNWACLLGFFVTRWSVFFFFCCSSKILWEFMYLVVFWWSNTRTVAQTASGA